MKLFKHKNHRNSNYLAWLRKLSCVASGEKAECAHHIRIGTNGGSALKPSDYFCIPLTHECHTTGSDAIHRVGEETFFEMFKLKKKSLFITYLKKYLLEELKLDYRILSENEDDAIADMIKAIGSTRSNVEKIRKKSKKTHSLKNDEFYIRSKERKRLADKEVREKLKISKPNLKRTRTVAEIEFNEEVKKAKRILTKELRKKLKFSRFKKNEGQKKKIKKKEVTKNESYLKAKEKKRLQDKELRLRLKESKAKGQVEQSESQRVYLERAKEKKRLRDKELRLKIKAEKEVKKVNLTDTEYYKKAKEFKRTRDKEMRAKLKEQRF